MNDQERLEKLFEEVGPLLGEARIDHYPDAGLWHVIVGELADMVAEPDPTRECLVLESSLATPPADKAAQLYEFLIRVNFLWKDTSGLRFALEEPGGAITLIRDHPIATFHNTTDLAKALTSFAERAAYWRLIVETGGPDPEASHHMPEEEGMIQI